jgi:hypothetical protein
VATNNLDALLARLKDHTASRSDIEDGVRLLKLYNYSTVSAQLFKLADLVRERLAADPKLAREVWDILDKERG